MPTFKITLAYDGGCFAGWQLQPGQRTVQGVLEVVLRQLTGQSVRVLGASRTDTGVHALGQAASFTLDARFTPEELGRAMNALLPPDVVVLQVEEAPPEFRPSRDATAKCYRYLIYDGPIRHIFLRRYAWQIDYRLDAQAMHQAAQRLIGTHDFASFQSRGSPRQDTIRTIFEISVRRCGAGQGGLFLGEGSSSESPTSDDRAGQGEWAALPSRFSESPTPAPREGAGQGGGRLGTPPQDPLLLCGLGCPIAPAAPASGASLPGPTPAGFGDADAHQSRAEQETPSGVRRPVGSLAESVSAIQQGQGGDVVVVEVEGDGFLYHMVRAIVGTLVEVGRGKRSPEWMADVLAARNRSAAGKTAPPEGLYLLYVRFDKPSIVSPQRSQS